MDHSPVFKQVTLENLEAEHICCCISDKKGENCVSSKKSWLRNRMQEGLVFNKLDVRGKVFIEYLPAEFAWAPIKADGYMYYGFPGNTREKGMGTSCWINVLLTARPREKGVLSACHLKKRCRFFQIRDILSTGDLRWQIQPALIMSCSICLFPIRKQCRP